MATSGPNQAGAVAEFDDGWAAWSNIAKAITDDNDRATVVLDESDGPFFSNFVDYTTFGTFTGVSAGDAITDINVEVDCKVSAGRSLLYTIQLLKDGSPVGDPASANTSITNTSDEYKSPGPLSLSGAFGTTLVGSELTSGFGVRIQFFCIEGTAITLSADACRMTVTYTPSGVGSLPKKSVVVGKAVRRAASF